MTHLRCFVEIHSDLILTQRMINLKIQSGQFLSPKVVNFKDPMWSNLSSIIPVHIVY